MKPSLAIETFKSCELDSTDLLLCGLDRIDCANYDFAVAQYANKITDENCIGNVIGYGPDKKFFYKLMSYKDNVVVGHERGIGYAYQLDGRNYFKREIPLVYGTSENQFHFVKNKISQFIISSDNINVISSDAPPNLAILLYDKNCIISSRDAFVPFTLKVLENSFLARIGENDLANVSFDSSEFSDIIADAITKHTKQLPFKASKLNASKLAVKQLQLESNNGSGAKAGTFVYDAETDSVKFYNGIKWRTLKWEDEEKSE